MSLLHIIFFFINKKFNTFLLLNEHMLLVFTEAPHGGTSNKYPQHMFSWRNKKKYLLDSPLIWSHVQVIMHTLHHLFKPCPAV